MKPDSGSGSPKSSGPLDTLQAGRGLAALAVVFFHINQTLALPKYLGHDVWPLMQSGKSGVDYFFVLSGFVIMLAHSKDIGKLSRVWRFAMKRFIRLYPPLWAVLLIVIGLDLAMPATRSLVTPWNVASAFTISPAPTETLLTVEWTLRHEMLFYAIFALILVEPRIGLIVGALWMVASAIVPWLGYQWPVEFFFVIYHLLFGFGVLTCWIYMRGRILAPWLVFLAGLAIFAATFVQPNVEIAYIKNFHVLGYGIGAMLAVLGGTCLEREGKLSVWKPLTVLGDASYSLYLVHFPVVSFMCRLDMKLVQRVPEFALFALTVVVATLFGLAFRQWVELPLIKAVGTLLAARQPPAKPA